MEHCYPVEDREEDFNPRKDQVRESHYKLDLTYLKRKPVAFTNFLNY